MAEETTKVYSYHTFILPFTWNMYGVTSDKEYEALKRVFEDNPQWENTNLKDANDISSNLEIGSLDEALGYYKQYQYYYPYVRKSFLGYEDGICSNYLLKGARNKGTYQIIKDDKHYVLNINAIRVRLVNTGVGLFIMECENHGKDGKGENQTGIETVKNINDYGRRITLPFINNKTNISADKLIVDIPNVQTVEDDFKGFIEKVYEKKEYSPNDISLEHTCDFIKKILSFGSEYRFTSKQVEKEKEICMKPALDDRMYVAFAVSDEAWINSVKFDSASKHYNFETEDALRKSIYEIAYADSSGSCTCPDEVMCLDLINKALYKRWIPWGSLYTITPMGTGMVSSAAIGGEMNFLYENFISCYLQMLYIAIVQKASIVKFNRETADIAKHFAANGRKLKRDDIRNIMNLQERHAAFDSQLLFSEVSSEQQAIEMYDMLKETLLLDAEEEKLNESLTSLYEITDTDLNISVNTIVEILTYVSIILAIASFAYNFVFASEVIVIDRAIENTAFNFNPHDFFMWLSLLLVFVLSVFIGIRAKWRNRRK